MALECIDPGAIRDWELEAYMDGETLPCVAAHLERCPACSARLNEARRLQLHLAKSLYRFDCPPVETLQDYHWNHLPPDRREEVAGHLACCPHCSAELARIRAFVAGESEPVSDTLWERVQRVADQVRVMVARLLTPDTTELVPVLRGEAREVLLFEAGDMALSLNLEQHEAGTYGLFGQLLPAQTPTAFEGSVRLVSDRPDRADLQAHIGSNGSFELTPLQPGTYQLVISLPDAHIVVPALDLRRAL